MIEFLIFVLVLLAICYVIFAFFRAIYRKIGDALDERSFVRSEQERADRDAVSTQSSRQRVQRQVDSSDRVHSPEDSFGADRERQTKERREFAEYEAEMARIQREADERRHERERQIVEKRKIAEREADERLLERESVAQSGGIELELERRALHDQQRREYKLKHNIREFSAFVSGRYTLTPSQCKVLWSNRPDSDKCRNVTGVYILHNETQDRYYVGQSVKVFNRLTQHFSGKNGNMDVLMDYLRGDHWNIQIIRLRDTTYDNLDDLERYAIALYDAFESGYNATRGNGNWVATGDLRREVLPNTDQYFARKVPAAQVQKSAVRPVQQKQERTSPPIDRQRRVRRSTRSTRKVTNAA